ncbi:hypothetical protein VNI00_012742 [Paramarasmius palmivorus]|uniref:Uncharacterized protein n=1 Tax=Paramarasmius palmivorus TaxID=297713 RepID=A0AAW0C5D0_9AGAR
MSTPRVNTQAEDGPPVKRRRTSDSEERVAADVEEANSAPVEYNNDLFVLAYERDRPDLPENTDIVPWGNEFQINEAVMTSIVTFGLQHTNDLQCLRLKSETSPYGLTLGQWLPLRIAADKWLENCPLKNPFFSKGTKFLSMPLEVMLYLPHEQKVLKKLQEHGLNDTALLSWLSKDHVSAVGLTDYDCFRLQQAANRDAFEPTRWNGPWRNRDDVLDATSTDFWVLGNTDPKDLPEAMGLSEWCRRYGLDVDVSAQLGQLHIQDTNQLSKLFIPRISLGHLLSLRNAAEKWLGKTIPMMNKYPHHDYIYPNMDVNTFAPKNYEDEMRDVLAEHGVRNVHLLRHLSLFHVQALGWTPVVCCSLECAAARNCSNPGSDSE